MPGRSPDINLIPREPNYVGAAASPVHSGPWDYLARVPLVIYGPAFVRPGTYDGRVTMADLAPTTAALIDFEAWPPRAGHVLEESLLDASTPRLVITLLWDGGGWNVLGQHADSYPFLKRLMRRSAVFEDMEIGSSPSVTPPIHATLSTGTFPKDHGIPGLRIRTADGEYLDPFIGLDPANIELPTLADLYDRERDDEPVAGMLAAVNWHLAMIGQGAGLGGADRDPAVLFDNEGVVFTNESLYSLPDIGDPADLVAEARALDGEDGTRDGEWRGHPLDDPEVRYASPAHVAYQQHLLERLIEAESFGEDAIPDLLYVNFKPSDDAGHAWGMTSSEVAEVVAAQDAALQRLFSFLDRRIGKDTWVLILTADHGQTPYPHESGAWPIGGGELARDANSALDMTDDDEDLVDRVSSPGAYINREQLAANDLSLMEVARWVASYTVEQNLKEDDELPRTFEGRRDELLFDAVLAGRRLVSEACA